MPQIAQWQKNISLPFLAVLYPDGSMHSVCFLSFTQYDFIYIYNLDIYEVINYKTMVNSLIIHVKFSIMNDI